MKISFYKIKNTFLSSKLPSKIFVEESSSITKKKERTKANPKAAT